MTTSAATRSGFGAPSAFAACAASGRDSICLGREATARVPVRCVRSASRPALEDELLGPLDAAQREQLHGLLRRLADAIALCPSAETLKGTFGLTSPTR